MKVKIERCSAPIFWYKDYIGKVFEVEPREGIETTFLVLNPPQKAVDYVRLRNNIWEGNLYICIEDCEDEFFIAMRNVVEEEK